MFSALVILFKLLKTVRLQDQVGLRPQQMYLYALACLMAANQCDTNNKGKPLFNKNIMKAAFVSFNYFDMCLQDSEDGRHSVGFMTFDEFASSFQEYIVQMFNSILQTLDLRI